MVQACMILANIVDLDLLIDPNSRRVRNHNVIIVTTVFRCPYWHKGFLLGSSMDEGVLLLIKQQSYGLAKFSISFLMF